MCTCLYTSRDARYPTRISMGLGDYFSEKSEKDYILQGANLPLA